MRVSYVCENCDALIDELIIENEVKTDFSDALTGEERHDIMKKESINRHYIGYICRNCLHQLWINLEN